MWWLLLTCCLLALGFFFADCACCQPEGCFVLDTANDGFGGPGVFKPSDFTIVTGVWQFISGLRTADDAARINIDPTLPGVRGFVMVGVAIDNMLVGQKFGVIGALTVDSGSGVESYLEAEVTVTALGVTPTYSVVLKQCSAGSITTLDTRTWTGFIGELELCWDGVHAAVRLGGGGVGSFTGPPVHWENTLQVGNRAAITATALTGTIVFTKAQFGIHKNDAEAGCVTCQPCSAIGNLSRANSYFDESTQPLEVTIEFSNFSPSNTNTCGECNNLNSAFILPWPGVLGAGGSYCSYSKNIYTGPVADNNFCNYTTVSFNPFYVAAGSVWRREVALQHYAGGIIWRKTYDDLPYDGSNPASPTEGFLTQMNSNPDRFLEVYGADTPVPFDSCNSNNVVINVYPS